MLRKRLISVLTFNNGVLFRTKHFVPDYRYTANFVDAWSIDEIAMIDITRFGQGERQNFYEAVDFFARKCFVPIAAGGQVRTIEDFKMLLNAGADKIIVNTQAVEDPEFITRAAQLYGSQCVVVSIDARRNADGGYEVFTRCGTGPTGLKPDAWAREAERRGAGEILITSVDKDGSLEGYDNRLNHLVASAVKIPVLVSGGAGKWQDFVDGVLQGGASAICTTNIYHFTESSIQSAKKYLSNAGVLVRN
ncbi:MAG: imidazole glycerol phosphate synthase cyclase subunit [Candidatus Omnitrophota bacterium]